MKIIIIFKKSFLLFFLSNLVMADFAICENMNVIGVTKEKLFTPLMFVDVKDSELKKIDFKVKLNENENVILVSHRLQSNHTQSKDENENRNQSQSSFSIASSNYSVGYSINVGSSIRKNFFKDNKHDKILTFLKTHESFKHYFDGEKVTSPHINIVATTDFDSDSNLEYWIEYVTMYEQIGLAVFELQGSEFVWIVDYCEGCD